MSMHTEGRVSLIRIKDPKPTNEKEPLSQMLTVAVDIKAKSNLDVYRKWLFRDLVISAHCPSPYLLTPLNGHFEYIMTLLLLEPITLSLL